MFASEFLLLHCWLPQGIISNFSDFGEADHNIEYEQPGRLRIYTGRILVLQHTASPTFVHGRFANRTVSYECLQTYLTLMRHMFEV